MADKLSTNITIATELIVDRFNKRHNNKYDYSQVNYSRNFNKVKIKCNKHGFFEQNAFDHLQGKGCPKCSFSTSKSKGEFNTPLI